MEKQKFTLGTFIDTNNRNDIFFRRYFKKENQLVEEGEKICSIRIGKYESPFGHQLIEIKSPAKGHLMHCRKLDDFINSEDELFGLSEKEISGSPLLAGQFQDHVFSGNGSTYKFIKWFAKSGTYVCFNDPIYAYNCIKEDFIIHHAEVSGKIITYPLSHDFLAKGRHLYRIEHSKPFKIEPAKNIELEDCPCFVYLMKDFTNNFYKIGISNNPIYREKTLQSEKPSIDLLAAKRFPSRQIAESFEKALHKSFEQNRIRGEWFKLNQKEIEQITESLN